MNRRQFLGFTVAGLSMAVLAACGQPSSPSSASAKPAGKFTIGYFPNVTHAPALVAAASGGFKDALAGVNVDYKTFNAGPSLVEALFAGAVDVGYVGPSPAINGYTQSKGQALRIIAGAMSGGASFVVRPAAGIRFAHDLNGKKLASPQLGNTQDVSLRFYLQQNGLETKDKGGAVDVMPAQNPDIVNLFKQGQIDGAWVPEPWASTLVLQAHGDVFLDERTLWPDGKFSTVCLVATPKLLKDRPDAVTGVLNAHLKATNLIAASPDEAKKLVAAQIAKLTSQPMLPDVLDRSFSTQDVTYDPLISSIHVQADHAFALGFLGRSKPDLSTLFDLALLQAALSVPSPAAAGEG
ncbi:MAG: ABC transporter substrate-binding protein [Chloroflexota bacterium]